MVYYLSELFRVWMEWYSFIIGASLQDLIIFINSFDKLRNGFETAKGRGLCQACLVFEENEDHTAREVQ